LDELKVIFDISASARDALRKAFPCGVDIQEFARRAVNITCGLLLLENYDVFMQQGSINLQGKESNYYWVLLYLSGDAFVLDAVLPLYIAGTGDQATDIIFLPMDEAASMYGYSEGRDYEWQKQDCEENIWDAALGTLNITKPPGEIMEEIADSIF
jgi:hypothetical protein